MELSLEHNVAVNRRRRIVVQADVFGSKLGTDINEWIDYHFAFVDEPGTQIDSIWWDVGGRNGAIYPSEVLERFEQPGLVKWWDQGVDWVKVMVDESHKRNLEAWWSHRVGEEDGVPTATGWPLMMNELNPVKKAHPDWLVRTHWWQGLWNFAASGLREWQVAVLREVAENYDYDGIQVDFARSIPCLPVGRQWELRDGVTEFMRMMRRMTLEVEKQRGRPYLLAARVPRNLKGCHVDGFDVETWAEENLVDILTLGIRSMDVDVAGYRRITAGRNIKLQPCFDDHHATDGYQHEPIEFLRGVFSNWWQQGADSVVTFNWSNMPPDVYKPVSQLQAYHEIGSAETLTHKDKVFAVERRGGFPWAEGYFNRNDDAPLPATLAHDGRPTNLMVRICDNLQADADKVRQVTLRAVLLGARQGDTLEAQLNGVVPPQTVEDFAWKDRKIFSPAPQPAAGGVDSYKVDPKQKLLRLEFTVPPRLCHLGENQVSVRIVDRIPYIVDNIVLEKLEVHVEYNRRT